MNFQAIRNARKAAGVTQEQLAEVLGINRATLSKYETGVIEPSVSQLKTIAAALRIDFYVLANEIGNEWFDAGFEFAYHCLFFPQPFRSDRSRQARIRTDRDSQIPAF